MLDAFDALLQNTVTWLNANGVSAHLFDLNAALSLGLVSIACGLVGPFIVGNRMAFFSDAMAHTAFAGAALGMLGLLLSINPASPEASAPFAWIITSIMVAFGIIVGLSIAFVRERTGLSADAVIGVFFALAVGFGAMLIPPLRDRVNFDSEQFLFGTALFASRMNILSLVIVVIMTVLFVVFRFNDMTLAGFNPSLARTRNVSSFCP